MYKKILVRLSIILTILLIISAVAYAATSTRFTFAPAGPNGNFDMDMAVYRSQGTPGTYATHSYVYQDSLGKDLIQTYMGFVSNSSLYNVSNVAQLNTITSGTDSIIGEYRWVHEVSTLGWNPVSKKWVFFWMTYPRNGASSDDRKFAYGWMARKTMDNTTNNYPDPSTSTLSSKEDRVFVGSGYDNRLQSVSDPWAQGTPSKLVVPGDKYLLYTEPGVIYDSDGVLYMAVTGMYLSGTTALGDIILIKSTDDGLTWTYVSCLLTPGDASYINSGYSFFTASALYKTSTGAYRIIVSPQSSMSGLYAGLREFQFSDLGTGTLNKDANGHPILTFSYATSTFLFNHNGAGSFHYGTGHRIYGGASFFQTPVFRMYDYLP